MESVNCAKCGHRQQRALPGSWHCLGCGHLNVAADAGDVSPVTRMHVESALSMLGAFMQAQALPLVSLVETWWHTLERHKQERFAESLFQRLVAMVHAGKFDSLLEQPYHLMSLVKSLAGAEKKPLVDALVELLTRRLEQAEELNGYLLSQTESAMQEAYKEELQRAAKQVVAERQEVIEAAVRDHMPSIEEMTRRIVTDATDKMAADVRARIGCKGGQ